MTRVPFNLAKNLPEQGFKLIRTYKLMDDEAITKIENMIENIIEIVESGELHFKQAWLSSETIKY